MTTYELPIVGLYHRPPAIGLLKLLPFNANLWVRSEPSNAYDPNAIAVDLDVDLLNLTVKTALRREIEALFIDWTVRHPDKPALEFESIIGTGLFHMGYLAATEALNIRIAHPDFDRARGTLRFGAKILASGKPSASQTALVRFTIED